MINSIFVQTAYRYITNAAFSTTATNIISGLAAVAINATFQPYGASSSLSSALLNSASVYYRLALPATILGAFIGSVSTLASDVLSSEIDFEEPAIPLTEQKVTPEQLIASLLAKTEGKPPAASLA
jgi:hypothetical protein